MEVNASVENKKSNEEVISRKGGIDVRYDRFLQNDLVYTPIQIIN